LRFAARARGDRRHNRPLSATFLLAPMGFFVRLLVCVAAVLSLSVLAAIAWDGSDDAAAATAPPAARNSAP